MNDMLKNISPINEQDQNNQQEIDQIKSIVAEIYKQYIDPQFQAPQKYELYEIAISESINCALTLQKLKKPAKTKECQHFWAIELEYFKTLEQCPCKIPINDNVVIDEIIQKLLDKIDELNSKYFDQNYLNQYQDSVMFFKRSLLFFPCLDKQIVPQPLPLLKHHILSPSETKLSYNFILNVSNLTNIKNTIIRVCDGFCIYDLNNINFVDQIVDCQYCNKSIDVFKFQVDQYLMKVRNLFNILQKKLQVINGDIIMQYGKFKVEKTLFTPDNIDQKILQLDYN